MTDCLRPTPIDVDDVTALDAVLAIQARCYGAAFHESRQAFAAKLRAAPGCAWLVRDALGQPQAYLFTLPTREDALPALNAQTLAPCAAPTLLYLHDLAVLPEARAQRLPQRLLQAMRGRAAALGLSQLALIAVQGAAPYWQRHGFAAAVADSEALRHKLASFGEGAVWMRQSLA